MTEQEQKAIEILDTFELRRISRKYNKLDLNDVYASQIVLNLISNLQKEVEQLENKLDNSLNEQKEREKYTHSLEEKLDKLQKENKKLQADIEIKDKVIDLMAEDIRQVIGDDNYMEMTRDETIEKYYREVEKVGGEDE